MRAVHQRHGGKADGSHHEAGHDGLRCTQPLRDRWREHGAHHEGQCPGHGAQASHQWRQTQHELQVLRDEDVNPEHGKRGERVRADGCGKPGLAEQLDVQQRVRDAALAAHKCHTRNEAQGQSHPGQGPQVALRRLFESKHTAQHCGK
ncbi:hypothetical protein D9M68_836960 [compost metagenome]